ncbi:MAG TPA: thermonuclease family protein [Patescibacteria group bacterium]|nr:thermonuclease family protein [Patescibacteria group bacterium]
MTKRILSGFIAAVFFVSLFAGAGPVARAQEEDQGAAVDTNPFERKKPYIPITTAPTDLDLVAVGTVKEILKTTLIRFEDGKVYSLINVRIPVVYDGKALDYMKSHYVGKKVGVYQRNFPGVMLNDRYGNLAGHIVTENNEWMQADLVLQGLAWVDSTPRNRDLVRKLYSYETIARNQRKGFWAAPAFMVKNATSILDKSMNSFQVVEDIVKSAKGVQDKYYFNYGENPAKDFTFIMEQTLGNNFVDEENHVFTPWRWKDHRIRVRGWVKDNSGPMIEVTHPEQLEFVGMESEIRKSLAPGKKK